MIILWEGIGNNFSKVALFILLPIKIFSQTSKFRILWIPSLYHQFSLWLYWQINSPKCVFMSPPFLMISITTEWCANFSAVIWKLFTSMPHTNFPRYSLSLLLLTTLFQEICLYIAQTNLVYLRFGIFKFCFYTRILCYSFFSLSNSFYLLSLSNLKSHSWHLHLIGTILSLNFYYLLSPSLCYSLKTIVLAKKLT